MVVVVVVVGSLGPAGRYRFWKDVEFRCRTKKSEYEHYEHIARLEEIARYGLLTTCYCDC